jgi:hypothetical protein
MNKMATWPLYTYFYFNGWILTPPENGVTLLPFALAFDFVLVGELQFSYIDLLKLSGFFTYHQVYNSEILHGARFALSVLYGSQNRQRLLLYTSLTGWFL